MVPLLQRVTLEKPQSNQRALAPPLGTSLRLGVPERRLESVGNPAGRRVSRVGPWMARRGGPRIQAFVRAHRSLSEVPSGGARALWLLWGFSKVTRRKGGTISRHLPNTGYAPQHRRITDTRRPPTIHYPIKTRTRPSPPPTPTTAPPQLGSCPPHPPNTAHPAKSRTACAR